MFGEVLGHSEVQLRKKVCATHIAISWDWNCSPNQVRMWLSTHTGSSICPRISFDICCGITRSSYNVRYFKRSILMAKKNKSFLRQTAEQRPLFAPVHSVHMTEKDRPRRKLTPRDVDYNDDSEDYDMYNSEEDEYYD